MSRTNKSVEIAERIVEGMKNGDMDANRTFHRLFKRCIEGLPEPTAQDERECERAIAMVPLVITLLLPVPARMDFMAATEEEDDSA
jgi:hypothetical protein